MSPTWREALESPPRRGHLCQPPTSSNFPSGSPHHATVSLHPHPSTTTSLLSNHLYIPAYASPVHHKGITQASPWHRRKVEAVIAAGQLVLRPCTLRHQTVDSPTPIPSAHAHLVFHHHHGITTALLPESCVKRPSSGPARCWQSSRRVKLVKSEDSTTMGATSEPDAMAAPGGAGAGPGPAWAAPAAVIATLSSLSVALQSLFNRLAAARLARGDAAGAERARNIANQVGNGMQWWTGLGTLSWDYVTNYVFQQSLSRGMGVSEALGHLSALSSIVGEVTQLRSDSERLQWITRNYSRAFTVAKSTMGNLLSVFDHDGAIRNCVLSIQRELLEGDLLRDVLKFGPNDLEGIVRMSKEVLQRIFVPAQPGQREGEL